jgi:peptide/nickel transport system substrate-binding protein
MYQQQNGEMDHAKRVAIVKRMQRKLFEDSPYLVTAYTTTGEAVRSDRFACFQPQPDPGGVWLVQYGAHNYVSLRPADKAGNCDGVTSALGASKGSAAAAEISRGGGHTPVLVGAGVVVLLLLAGGGALVARRRVTSADRE